MKWRYLPHQKDGDCVIRALACATGRTYDDCEEELASTNQEFRDSQSYEYNDRGILSPVNDVVYRAYGYKYITFEVPQALAVVTQEYPNCIMVIKGNTRRRCRSEHHIEEHTSVVKRGRIHDDLKGISRDRSRNKGWYPIVVGVYVRRRNRRTK